MTPDLLFNDYEYYRLFTSNYRRLHKQGIPLKTSKKTEYRLNQLKRLIVFCEENKVDPRRYLHSLFQARHWNFAPRWDHLVPATEKTKAKVLSRYHSEISTPLYSQRIQHNSQNIKHDSTFDPNRDISTTVETIKRRYILTGDTDRCMGEVNKTLGYHPKSTVCIKCPVSKECEARLQASVPFDITELRLGNLSTDQARRVAGWYNATR